MICVVSFLQTFQLTFLLFAFGNSYRPRGIFVEKSIDYGATFLPLEYIVNVPSNDCQELFNVAAEEYFVPGSNNPELVLCRAFFGNPMDTSGYGVCSLVCLLVLDE